MSSLNLDNLNLEQNKLLNEIADKAKFKYNELIEILSEDKIDNINWIVGSIASRNKYQSKLFERCCKLILMQKLIDSKFTIKRIETFDAALAKIIKDYVQKHKFNIKVISKETFLGYLWRITRPFRQLIIATYQFSWRFINRSKKYAYHFNKIDAITLLDTFVLNSTPGAGGTINNKNYNDRYYTGIFDHLTHSESKNIYYLPTIVGFWNPASMFSTIRNCEQKFIIPDDFLSLSDFLKILSHPFKLHRIKIPNILFQGLNIKSLIKQEIYNTCSDQISLLSILYYIFPYRLRSKGIKVRLLVDWFENQVIDRGLVCGFHKFLPKAKTIGYQGYIISPALHLYIFPNRTELLSKAIPNKIGVIGEGLIKQIKIFSKDLNIVVSPAFRFQKLWDKRKTDPSKDFFTILISLPISLKDSKNILDKITFVNDNLADLSINYRMIIKPHPTYTIEKIKSLVKYNWDRIYKFSSGDFVDILEQSDLVITNASSTAVEPLARAVPVIIVGDKNGILQNPIPNTINKEMWNVCYSKIDIQKNIIQYSKIRIKNNYKKEAKKIRAKYFAKTNRKTVKNFLHLN